MRRLRETIKHRPGRHRVGTDIRVVINDLNSMLRKERGRDLRAGQAQQWTQDWFNGHNLHQLRGTIRYPKAA